MFVLIKLLFLSESFVCQFWFFSVAVSKIFNPLYINIDTSSNDVQKALK